MMSSSCPLEIPFRFLKWEMNPQRSYLVGQLPLPEVNGFQQMNRRQSAVRKNENRQSMISDSHKYLIADGC